MTMETAVADRSALKERIFDHFRRWGYLSAHLDPLGVQPPAAPDEIELDGEFAESARHYYCGSIGAEFMHIPVPERRLWIQEQMEAREAAPERALILEALVAAEVFEQELQKHYPGTKRFSLEGLAALIPLLQEILNNLAEHGAEEVLIGMSHRGRLNVMAQIVGTSPADIFAEFEDVDPRSVLGGGDVKYHLGATGYFTAANGRRIQVRLVSSPSHLEAVDPVALGRVRAKQVRAGETGMSKVVPILIHGDAAFAGQGIAAETLNLAGLDGYAVGGTIHIIANNLIGFTAVPGELHSSAFASDVAKRLPIPVLHVNGEDPDAVVHAGRMASAYRSKFSSDVVIDLVGFRRHGHSEIDDPTMTQPLLYARIAQHPPLWKLYAGKIDLHPEAMVESAHARYDRARSDAASIRKVPRLSALPEYWSGYTGGRYDPAYEVDTGVPVSIVADAARELCRIPAGFHAHPKVLRLIERRIAMAERKTPVDFGMAELLAFATLLREGISIRLSGQDSRRGTFGQRHAVLVDVVDEKEYFPLSRFHTNEARSEIRNSILSEAAVLGFEHGYSRERPDGLVLWEAQFGDFANGAQVIIDQFIAAGEDKWGLLSGLVLLLPHGYEGQGPEHSSARLERFLQLAAEDNFQICQPSTAAQYFHLLRRQALRKWRKPLVVLTPKSMLRLPDAGSSLEEFARPRFLPVLPDPDVREAERVIVCTGKIGRELMRERRSRGYRSTAVIFVEQVYPFPQAELASELKKYPAARELVWVQEEPGNMGAYSFIIPRLEELSGGVPVRSVKRSVSASTATGSAKAHELEQKALISLAFSHPA